MNRKKSKHINKITVFQKTRKQNPEGKVPNK